MHNKKFSKEFIEKWSHLIEDIDMDDVPIQFVDRLELYFNNGQNPAFIDITLLLEDEKPRKVEKRITMELDAIDDILDRVDFHLNLEKVVETVDIATKDTLKKL